MYISTSVPAQWLLFTICKRTHILSQWTFTKCRSTVHSDSTALIQIWILAFCLCNLYFFLALHCGLICWHCPTIDIDIGACSAQQLARNRKRYSLPGESLNIFGHFLHIQSYSDNALIQKPIIVTHAHTGRIVLHFKSVIQHCSTTKFRWALRTTLFSCCLSNRKDNSCCLFQSYAPYYANAKGCSVKRPVQAVHKRFCWIPCYFFSPRGVLCCSIPAHITRKAWTKALQCSLQGSCTAQNLGGTGVDHDQGLVI